MARSIFVLFSWLTILCGLCSLPGGLSHARDLGRRHIIVGTVLSANGDSVLIGANVVLTGRDRHTETDSLGQFTFDDVAPGSYSLRVTHVGYAPRVDEGRVEASTDTLFVSFRLTEAPAVMGNISVTSQTPLPRPDELVSQHVFDDHHLQTSPQFAEDVYRAVARIPGVSADDYSARFRVRGGEHDEVLVLLDGLELIEPFHVKDVEGGIMSIVDVAALEQASLLTGGFSAAYGNRKSAVFDLQSRRPPQNGARMSAGVSLLNARAMSEGTFLDRRGSWLVSARRGYAELILPGTLDEAEIRPAYWDILSKVAYSPSPDHTLSLHSLVAADDFVFIEPGHDAHADFSDVYLWARGQSRFGPNVNLETVVSIGKLWEKGQDDANSPEGVQYAHHTKTYRFYDIKQSVEIRPNSRWRAAWGWSVRNDETQMAFLGAGEVYFLLSPTYDTYRTHRLDADYSLRGKHKSVFTSHQMTVNDRLSTEIGLRYDIVDLSDDNLWSPRVSARYQLGTKTALRAAWGFYFQPQESYQLDIQDDSLVFSDAERSEHVIAEFEQGLGQSAMLALRGYRKITDNPRPRYRDWANRIDLYDELLASSYRIACDHAVSEGLELSLQSSEQATLTWQASYTLARFTEHVTDVTFLSFRPRQLNDDRPSPFDQRHTVYLDAEYRLSPIWQINVAWQYHSGRPYSKPQFNWDYYDNPDVSFYDLGELNAERYPASHRLDLRITRSFTSSWGRFAAFLEVINLYDHQNVRAYSYDVVNYGENDYRLLTKTWYWLGIVPSVGIRWTWGG